MTEKSDKIEEDTVVYTIEQQVLNKCAQTDSLRNIAARNQNCPKETLIKLYNHLQQQGSNEATELTYIHLAQNRNSNPQMLKDLAHNTHVSTQLAVAQNSVTDPESLQYLAQSPSTLLRTVVAKNRNTPNFCLQKLALDSDEGVRGAVAENEVCESKILAKLADDTVWFVQKRVVANPKPAHHQPITSSSATLNQLPSAGPQT